MFELPDESELILAEGNAFIKHRHSKISAKHISARPVDIDEIIGKRRRCLFCAIVVLFSNATCWKFSGCTLILHPFLNAGMRKYRLDTIDRAIKCRSLACLPITSLGKVYVLCI